MTYAIHKPVLFLLFLCVFSSCFEYSANEHSADVCFEVAKNLSGHLSTGSLPPHDDAISSYPAAVLELARRAVTYCRSSKIREYLQLSSSCELASVVAKNCELGEFGVAVQVSRVLTTTRFHLNFSLSYRMPIISARFGAQEGRVPALDV